MKTCWRWGLVALLLSVPLHAGTVVCLNFTNSTADCALGPESFAGGNLGTSAVFGPAEFSVVVSARTSMGDVSNPGPAVINTVGPATDDMASDPLTNNLFGAGEAGTVFWGNLGGEEPTDSNPGRYCLEPIGVSNACPGLGVQAPDATGSKSISGDEALGNDEIPDDDEILLFTWHPTQLVSPSSIILTLQGFFQGEDETHIYFELLSNTNPTGPDYVFTWEHITSNLLGFTDDNTTDGMAALTLNFGDYDGMGNPLPGLPSGVLLQLGVHEGTEHIGVAGITYESEMIVPEPSTFLLGGIALAAVALYRRRRGKAA